MRCHSSGFILKLKQLNASSAIQVLARFRHKQLVAMGIFVGAYTYNEMAHAYLLSMCMHMIVKLSQTVLILL